MLPYFVVVPKRSKCIWSQTQLQLIQQPNSNSYSQQIVKTHHQIINQNIPFLNNYFNSYQQFKLHTIIQFLVLIPTNKDYISHQKLINDLYPQMSKQLLEEEDYKTIIQNQNTVVDELDKSNLVLSNTNDLSNRFIGQAIHNFRKGSQAIARIRNNLDEIHKTLALIKKMQDINCV